MHCAAFRHGRYLLQGCWPAGLLVQLCPTDCLLLLLLLQSRLQQSLTGVPGLLLEAHQTAMQECCRWWIHWSGVQRCLAASWRSLQLLQLLRPSRGGFQKKSLAAADCILWMSTLGMHSGGGAASSSQKLTSNSPGRIPSTHGPWRHSRGYAEGMLLDLTSMAWCRSQLQVGAGGPGVEAGKLGVSSR